MAKLERSQATPLSLDRYRLWIRSKSRWSATAKCNTLQPSDPTMAGRRRQAHSARQLGIGHPAIDLELIEEAAIDLSGKGGR